MELLFRFTYGGFHKKGKCLKIDQNLKLNNYFAFLQKEATENRTRETNLQTVDAFTIFDFTFEHHIANTFLFFTLSFFLNVTPAVSFKYRFSILYCYSILKRFLPLVFL